MYTIEYIANNEVLSFFYAPTVMSLESNMLGIQCVTIKLAIGSQYVRRLVSRCVILFSMQKLESYFR